MSTNNLIEIHPEAVPKEVCEYFINFFEEQHKLGRTVAGGMGAKGQNTKLKNSIDLGLMHVLDHLESTQDPQAEELATMIDRYEAVVDQKFTEFFIKYHSGLGDIGGPGAKPASHFDFATCRELKECPLIHRYDPPGQGYHVWHSDWSPFRKLAAIRLLVGMVYLNDVEEGGENRVSESRAKGNSNAGHTCCMASLFHPYSSGKCPD